VAAVKVDGYVTGHASKVEPTRSGRVLAVKLGYVARLETTISRLASAPRWPRTTPLRQRRDAPS
jgi:hypothetical protein